MDEGCSGMNRENHNLEKEIENFLKEDSNVFMRRASQTVVFIETGYVCMCRIVNYVNYLDLNKEGIINRTGEGAYSLLQTGVPFLMAVAGLGLSYGASKLYGYFYNQVAKGCFRRGLKKEK